MDLIAILISAFALVASIYALVQSHHAQDLDKKYKKLAETDLLAKQAPKIQVIDEKVTIARPKIEGHPIPSEKQIAIRYSAIIQNKGSEVAHIKSITLESRPVDSNGKEVSYGMGALVVGSLYLAVNERISIEREIDSTFLMFVRDFGEFQDAPLLLKAIFTYSGYAGAEITHKTGLLKLNKDNRLQGYSNWKPPTKEPRSYPLKAADS